MAVDAATTGDNARIQARELVEALRSFADRSQPLRTLKVAALGIPNVGKSSLLNLIGGRHKAKTGAKPGLTRGQQWLVIAGGIWLLDLPGVLPPAPRTTEETALLALLGTLPSGAFSETDAALFLLARLAAEWGPGRLAESLRLPPDAAPLTAAQPEPLDWLNAWALRRGVLGLGGIPDAPRAADILVAEFRRGNLGRFSLERPPGADSV